MKKNKSDQFSLQTISHLPVEIITDIFSRLAFEDLQISQLVCKDWCKTLNSNLNCFILCCTHKNTSKFYTVSYRADCFQIPLKARSLHTCLPKERFMIVGSAKGRVCVASLTNYGVFYVVNPVTGRTFKLPKPRSKPIEPRAGDYLPCGFAYDKTSSTYKVVYLVSSWTVYNGVKTAIEIFSFSTSMKHIWKRTQDHPSFVSRDGLLMKSMVFLNGALHWLAKDSEFVSRHRNSGVIGLIDVADESFKLLATPALSTCTSLGILSDCLSFCGEFKDGFKIWVMKDYGVEHSWTVEYSFQREIFGPLHKLDCVYVLRRKSNGSVLLHCGDCQGYYDFDKNEFQEIVFHEPLPRADYMEIINHDVNLTSFTVLNF